MRMYFSVCLLSVYVCGAAFNVDKFENADNVSNELLPTLNFRMFY